MKKTKTLLLLAVITGFNLNSPANTVESLKKKALLYMPMDKNKVMQTPVSGANVELLDGKPCFVEGKKGEALVVDSEGVSIKGIRLKGKNLIDGKQGAIALWIKPLVNYTEGKGKHYFLVARKNNGHFVYIASPGGGFFFQTVKDKKWISPHFNFKWWKKPSWSTTTWYHIAVNWGPKIGTEFYVNGTRIFNGKKNSGTNIELDTLFIGCSSIIKEQADSLIDELYIFKDILTKEDIGLLMHDK